MWQKGTHSKTGAYIRGGVVTHHSPTSTVKFSIIVLFLVIALLFLLMVIRIHIKQQWYVDVCLLLFMILRCY